MISVENPINHISGLWRTPDIDTKTNYRLMKYVIREDYDKMVVLHNLVTGQLVILEEEEKFLINSLPVMYSSHLKQLIMAHFLVPIEYEENKTVVSIRNVLRKMMLHKKEDIVKYVILPTTACNARCYYCFEAGVKPVTMTAETAENVIDFISSRCGEEKKVAIEWFGGEPTIASQRIDQICDGLKQRGINFSSSMVTNGFLFDNEMVKRAKSLWNMYIVQISVDGVGSTYNRIKSYVNSEEDAYQKVIQNIKLLLENNIKVSVRMNTDLHNFREFEKLVNDLLINSEKNDLLRVYAYPIIGEYLNGQGLLQHGNEIWMGETIEKLNAIARKHKLQHPKQVLPHLEYQGCMADNGAAIVIGADGMLCRCLEDFSPSQSIGTIVEGITNRDRVEAWKKVAVYAKCEKCVFFPVCVKLVNCRGGENCIKKYERMTNSKYLINKKVQEYLCKGDGNNGI